MNKYDEKIMLVAKNADSINEVMRMKKLSFIEKVIDFITDAISIVDSFKVQGSFYLVTRGKKIELVLIAVKTLDITIYDVTEDVNNATNSKKFEYDGNYYKIVKKLK